MAFDPSSTLQFGVQVAVGFLGVFVIPVIGVKWCSRWLWRLKL